MALESNTLPMAQEYAVKRARHLAESMSMWTLPNFTTCFKSSPTTEATTQPSLRVASCCGDSGQSSAAYSGDLYVDGSELTPGVRSKNQPTPTAASTWSLFRHWTPCSHAQALAGHGFSSSMDTMTALNRCRLLLNPAHTSAWRREGG